MKRTKRENKFSRLVRFWHRERRRYCAIALCASLIAGNIGNFAAVAGDDPDYRFELDQRVLNEALQKAIANGSFVEEGDLLFTGLNAEAYQEALEVDGCLYELSPEFAVDADDELSLRIFVRLSEVELIDDVSEDTTEEADETTIASDGTENIFFLLTNTSKDTQTAVIRVGDKETELITVASYDAVEMEDDEIEKSGSIVTVGSTSSGGGNGGSSVSNQEKAAEDEAWAEDTGTENPIEDVEITIPVENITNDETVSGDVIIMTGNDKESDREVNEECKDGETLDDVIGNKNEESADDAVDSDVGEDRDDDGIDNCAGSESGDNAGGSGDDSESDDAVDNSDGTEADDVADSSDDTEANNTADSNNDTGAGDVADQSDDTGTDDTPDNGDAGTDDDVNDEDNESIASISLHKTYLVSEFIASWSNASPSDAEEADEASPSDATESDAAKESLDGITYETVRLADDSAAMFETTLEELGIRVEYAELSLGERIITTFEQMKIELEILEESRCFDFYDQMLKTYFMSFDGIKAIVSGEEMRTIDSCFGELKEGLEEKYGYTDHDYYSETYDGDYDDFVSYMSLDEDDYSISSCNTNLLSVASVDDEIESVSEGGSEEKKKPESELIETSKAISGELNEYTIQLEAYVESLYKEVKQPSDIVLVLDQSASMYAPIGVSKAYLDNQSDYEDTTAVVSAGDLESNTGKSNAEHLGYYIARSTSAITCNYCGGSGKVSSDKCKVCNGEGSGRDWFVIQYKNSKWNLYRVPNTSTPHLDKDSWYYSGNESNVNEPIQFDSLDSSRDSTIGNYSLTFYKTQYSALYEAIVDFVETLKSSGANHRVAIVGFSGDLPDKTYSNGSGIYVDGIFHDFSNSISTSYEGNPYGIYTLYDNALGEYYDDALAYLQDETDYGKLLDSIDAISTDYYNTCHYIGMHMADQIIANAPTVDTDIAEVPRTRSIILFTDGVPSATTNGLKAAGDNVAISIQSSTEERAEYAREDLDTSVYTIYTSTVGDEINVGFLQDAAGANQSGGNDANYCWGVGSEDGLINAFQTISSQVEVASAYDSYTVLQDTIAKGFTIDSSRAIKVYSVDADAIDTDGNVSSWTNYTDLTDTEGISIATFLNADGLSVVQVSGFNYANYSVGTDTNGVVEGKKLVVYIPIVPKDETVVGYELHTNDEYNSGVYYPVDQNGNGEYDDDVLDWKEAFAEPKVDIPVKVTVKKVVEGNLGDREKEFTFKATYKKFAYYQDGDGSSTATRVSYDRDEYYDDEYVLYLKTVAETVVDKEIQLHHEETNVFENVLPGTDFAINENDNDGYKTSVQMTVVYKDIDSETNERRRESSSLTNDSFKIPENVLEVEIVFTNTKNEIVDTGVILDSMPYIFILGVVVAGVAFYFIRKRKDDEDDLD